MSNANFREAMRISTQARMRPEQDSAAGNAQVPAAIQVHDADPDAHDSQVPNLALVYQTAKL